MGKNLKRLMSYDERMALPPATVLPDPTKGEVSYDDGPVLLSSEAPPPPPTRRVVRLPPMQLDAPPPADEAALAEASAGTAGARVARKPAPVEDPGPMDPKLAAALEGLGGVADRAQAQMEAGAPPSGAGGRLAGFMSGAAQSAAMGAATPQGRKPLTPPNGAAVPPEVAKFASDKMAESGGLTGARLERGLSPMLENVHAGLDIATRMKTPGYGNAMEQDADRQDAQVAAAKEFALKKLGLERQARQDALGEEKTRAEIDRDAAAAEKDRKGPAAKPIDPLAQEKTKAEIEEIKARTGKLNRHGSGAGGDPLGVPGYTRPPGAPAIKKEEAESMRAMIAAQQGMESPITAMEEAKKNTGREYALGGLGKGEDYAAQAGPYSQMVLNVKDLAKSGALDEQSERVAQGMIPTPEDSPDAATEKIKNLRAYVKSKVDAKAASLGYQKGEAAPAPATSSGSEMVRMIDPNGRPRMVPKARVQAALAAGGKMAQ
jgi:hypothetical protein